MKARALATASVMVLAALVPGVARAEPMTVGAQAGIWSAEAEWRSGTGPFVGVGFPWALYAIEVANGGESVAALEGKIGWDFALTKSWSLRTGPRFLWATSKSDPCGTGCMERSNGSWGLFEVGVRYEAASGLVAGLDVPLLALKDIHDNPRIPGGDEWWMAPVFSQVWLGWAWSL
jgi:hypothetical protein